MTLEPLFEAALSAVAPHRLIPAVASMRGTILTIDDLNFDLAHYHNCLLCGSGKAAAAMAQAFETILANRCGGGIVVAPDTPVHLQCATCIPSTHPLPSEQSVIAADAMGSLFDQAGPNDLIIYLLSGGTSALLEKPLPPLTLEDMINTTRILLENGCSIDEINAVRKHLSAIKGGRLAARTPATVVVLVISDVIGDDLQTIGSAPLHSDASTYREVVTMLQARELLPKLTPAVQSLLQRGAAGAIAETPKQVRPGVLHRLIASNHHALEAAAAAARERGIRTRIESRPLCGDVAAAAQAFAERFKVLPPGTLLLSGGETTVQVRGHGKGGRNQHFALLLLQHLHTSCSYTILCAGSDGIDGNSDAAGALISDTLFKDARQRGIDLQCHIDTFDSYTFFQQLDASIMTGYTGTNVMDVVLAYKG